MYSYFHSHKIHGIGYQDAGMTHNNPISIAVHEAKRLFESSQVSIAVSVSTGTPEEREQAQQESALSNFLGMFKEALSHILHDTALLRLVRVFTFMMKDASSRAYQSALEFRSIEGSQFFRFDVRLNSGSKLDSITNLNYMEEKAKHIMSNSRETSCLANYIRANYFIFELAVEPTFSKGRYECRGRVSCRLGPASQGFTALMNRLARLQATFYVQGSHIDTTFSSEDHFEIPVKFFVSSRSAMFDIKLQEEVDGYHISGSPFRIDQLIETQGLRSVFGNQEHQPRWRPNIPHGSKRKRNARMAKQSQKRRKVN